MPYVPQLFGQASAGLQLLSASATSNTISCSDSGRTIVVIDLCNGSAYSSSGGQITVKARLREAGHKSAEGWADSSGQWTVTNLSYVDRSLYTNANIAGSTICSASSSKLIEVDITGLEAQIVYARGSDSGSLGVRAFVATVSP
jgi:hypothetical protein